MKNYTNLFLIIICVLLSCTVITDPNRLDSDDFSTPKERVEELKSRINPFSDFTDAEFELFNVNGFGNSRVTIPGASSWDYKFVVKVDTSDVRKWVEGMIEFRPDNYDLKWTNQITNERASAWKTESSPVFYMREGESVIMVVYQPEGIIFKSVIQR